LSNSIAGNGAASSASFVAITRVCWLKIAARMLKKFVAITLLAFIVTVCGNPISISGNNIGDIVTVGVSANVSVENQNNSNIFSILAAILSQQTLVIATNEAEEAAPLPAIELLKQVPVESPKEVPVEAPKQAPVETPKFKITPEMIEKIKTFLIKK